VKRLKAKRRLGILLFLVPLIIIGTVIAYQLVQGTYSQTGTLIVRAQSSAKYYRSVGLNVSTTVGTANGVTPFELELTQGAYKVKFSEQKWYHTPADRLVNIPSGKTSYVVGVYDPIVETVSVSRSQFNSTELHAMHGITPIVWVNEMSDSVIIYSDLTGRVSLAPSQNFTYIFQDVGVFTFSLPLANAQELLVKVS
jgi:hypothetical protein